MSESERRQKALEDYRKRLIDHRELDAKLKKMREELKDLTKEYDKSEEDLKALQSGVGQIVGEVLRQLSEDKCVPSHPSLLPSVPSSPSPSFPPSFLLSLPPLHTSLSSFYSLSPSHS
jgi:folate-dependent phosphoribosylglycinamide formyltransferase PurN